MRTNGRDTDLTMEFVEGDIQAATYIPDSRVMCSGQIPDPCGH